MPTYSATNEYQKNFLAAELDSLARRPAAFVRVLDPQNPTMRELCGRESIQLHFDMIRNQTTRCLCVDSLANFAQVSRSNTYYGIYQSSFRHLRTQCYSCQPQIHAFAISLAALSPPFSTQHCLISSHSTESASWRWRYCNTNHVAARRAPCHQRYPAPRHANFKRRSSQQPVSFLICIARHVSKQYKIHWACSGPRSRTSLFPSFRIPLSSAILHSFALMIY
jgi:hypothetical protein